MWCNIEARSRNHCCNGRQYYILLCARARGWEVWVCLRACVRVCVCVLVGGCWCTSAGVSLRAFRFTYPVCHAQAPYCLRPLWLHHMLRHYLTNDTIFEKKVTEHKMCVFGFLYRFYSKQREIVMKVKRLQVKYTSLCRILMELWVLLTDFRKSLKYQISSKSVH